MQTSKGLNLRKGLDHQTQPNLHILVFFTLFLWLAECGQGSNDNILLQEDGLGKESFLLQGHQCH